jgi:hypothetical protein
MRTSILPLAVTVSLLAGCSADAPRRPERSAERDLTRRSLEPAPVEVASAIELARPEPKPPVRERDAVAPRPKPAPQPAERVEAAAAENVVVVPKAPIAILTPPAPEVSAAAGSDRELSPGETVTMIPASSGSSIAPDDSEPTWSGESVGTIGFGGGDTCRPRGGVRGIGVAGRFPGSVRAHHLR